MKSAKLAHMGLKNTLRTDGLMFQMGLIDTLMQCLGILQQNLMVKGVTKKQV